MMEGRMRKYYEDVVLLQQAFIMDDSLSIAKLLEKSGKDFGAPVEIEGFVLFKVGEGIEKAEADFADEVAQMAGTR
jgi:elongation factor Ts